MGVMDFITTVDDKELEFHTSGYMIFSETINDTVKNNITNLLNDVDGFNRFYEQKKLEKSANSAEMDIIGITDENDPEIGKYWFFRGFTVTRNGILFDYSEASNDFNKSIELVYLILNRLKTINVEIDTFNFTGVAFQDSGIIVTAKFTNDENED